MKTSQLFFRTFKEAPHEADVISHKLLERGGYLRKLSKGVYTLTPLMWRVLKKLMNLMREELDLAGAQEISMPFLHPKELWQQTGRWEDFTSANLLYTLKDRENHEFCLAPTHEEVVVSLVADWATSHKHLPFNLYQIGTKFRDEIRPRFGLIRAKEFLMKDGYSFSADPEGMEKQYEIMRTAYSRIFERCGLDFVIVEAHGGKIGKGKSEEFQVRAEIGEDAVMVADHYAANIEQAKAIPPPFSYENTQKEKRRVSTPNQTSIEQLCAFLKVLPQNILKTVVYKLVFPNHEEFVAVGIRGDRQINEVKVLEKFNALEIALASDEEVKKHTGFKPGYLGPMGLPIQFVADLSAEPMTNFVTGANEENFHFVDVNWKKDVKAPKFDDFLLAEAGDLCPHVPGAHYKMQRGIEVGHIFNLGTRYTEKLKAFFQDETGQTKPIWMGTYGIGVSRTAAAVIEQKYDEKGIVWPLELAPFRILITAANMKEQTQIDEAASIYRILQENGFEPLLDDRDERLGFKLKDSDLIGIPYKLIVGKTLADGNVEMESRKGEKSLIAKKEILDWAKKNLTLNGRDQVS